MEEAIRYTAMAIAALLCGLLLRKAEPAAATSISLITAAAIGTAAVTVFSVVGEFLRETEALMSGAEGTVSLLLKVLATVLVTGFGAQMCRDCGEGSLAMQLGLLGGMLAFAEVLPLVTGVFEMLRSMAGTA